MKNQFKLFACVIKQYGTGVYRACVRLGENHLVYLGAYPNEAGADAMMNRFLEAQRSGEVKTADDVPAFLASLHAGDCTVRAMPLAA
jgi:hypothetical protein